MAAIRQQMNKNIEKKIVDTSIMNHFQSLFKGIEVISHGNNNLTDATDDQRLAYVRKLDSEENAIELFDVLYYSGKLSFKVALGILRSPVVKDIHHLVALFNSGGTLFKWTPTERHAFRMQIANKYNVLGDSKKARELIVGWIDNWVRLAHAGELNRKTIMALGSALLAFDRGDYFVRLLNERDLDSIVKSAVPLYRVALSTGRFAEADRLTNAICATEHGEALLYESKYSVMLLASFIQCAGEYNLSQDLYRNALRDLGKKPNWAFAVPMTILKICEVLCKDEPNDDFVCHFILPRVERCVQAVTAPGILEHTEQSLLRARFALVSELCSGHGPVGQVSID